MDLIQSLIQAKKSDQEYDWAGYFNELIKYEKLSKSPKFKHIVDSPILQKQLPLCWAAFNDDARAYWMLNEAATIVQSVTTNYLAIFTDLEQHYSDRKRRQMEIIGNVQKYYISYMGIDSIRDPFNNEDVFYLTEEGENNAVSIAAVYTTETHASVFSGTLTLRDDDDEETDDLAVVPAYESDKNNVVVKIDTYSVQGNNDYEFALVTTPTDRFKVSMPDGRTFRYNTTANGKPVVIDVPISESDVSDINMNIVDVSVLAKYLRKYIPDIKEEGANDET